MIWVGNSSGQRIAEDRGSVLEGNAMFLEVPGGFLRVPLKLHLASLPPPSDVSGPISVGRTQAQDAALYRSL